MSRPAFPRPKVYPLLADGLDAPLRYGIRRALKHTGPSLSDEEIGRLVEAQREEILNWICEAFRVPE